MLQAVVEIEVTHGSRPYLLVYLPGSAYIVGYFLLLVENKWRMRYMWVTTRVGGVFCVVFGIITACLFGVIRTSLSPLLFCGRVYLNVSIGLSSRVWECQSSAAGCCLLYRLF